nr:NADH dehydrogenase subunit 2 [Exechonella vieirai]
MLKMYPSWMLYFSMSWMGLLLLSSTSNWLMIWISLEMILMSFIPMFMTSSLTIEGMMKYFLIQASSSVLLLLSILMAMKKMSSILLMLSIIMKLGLFPFFQWMPAVMMTLSWPGCVLLSTMQKISPIMLLSLMNLNKNTQMLTISTATLSILLSGMLGINQTKLRTLMAYSSISHMGWITAISMTSTKITLMYMATYFTLTTLLFFSFHKNNMNKTPPNKQSNLIMSTETATTMVALAGLPPLPLFWMKALIFLSFSSLQPLLYIMITGSVLSAFYYLSFTIPSLMMQKKSKNKNKQNIMYTLPLLTVMTMTALFSLL